MLDALAKEEVVFLGETHLDDNTHRLELAVYEGLVARRPGKVVLALEMFERDVQPVLDEYLAGRISEEEFLKGARPWGNYRSGYRPLIEAAKRHGLPVIASNAPAGLRMKVGRGGQKALDELPPEERAYLPAKLYDNTEDYWERVARVVRGHMGMIVGTTPEQRLTSGQSLWDNTMGESCAKALDKYPGALVLHINGGFHSAFRGGAVHQLLLRRPETRLRVVDIMLADDLYAFDPFGAEARADYLAFVLARSRAPSEGFLAVTAFADLRYRLHLPPGLAAGKTPPLLIWLGDDGLRSADSLAPLSQAFGEDVAIVAVEPPYPMMADDLALGGRWFWGETFQEDLGVLGGGLQRIITYLLRNYPIDPQRIVLAGEGTGATVIASTSLYMRSLDVPAIASAPRRYAKLRTLALPGPGEAAEGSSRRLVVLASGADEEWWQQEAEEWRTTGLDVAVRAAPRGFGATAAELRAALGLPAAEAAEGAKLALLLPHETPRARLWAETYALRLGVPAVVSTPDDLEGLLASGGRWSVKPLVFEGEEFEMPALPEGVEALPGFRVEELMDGRGLPLAAGPFGGTTILVVPRSDSDEQRAAWKQLEETGAISKRTRFARLVVLFDSDEGAGLAEALQAVKDAGRSSVLVVPAAFCADAEAMSRLRAEARPYEDILDLAYLPGLGGGAPVPHPHGG